MSDVIIASGNWQNIANGIYLPYVMSAYGVYYKVPYIGQEWRTASFPENRLWDYYEEGVGSPITWYDFDEQCNKLTGKNNFRYSSTFFSRHSTLLNGFTDISESALAGAKAEFNNDVEWLWGSLDEGGAFIIKSADDPSSLSGLCYFMALCFGEFEREEDNPDYSSGRYFYHVVLFGGGTRIPLACMKHVGFFIHDDVTHPEGGEAHDYTLISAYCASTNWYSGNLGGVIGSGAPEACTYDTKWTLGLGIGTEWLSSPVGAWYWEGGSANYQLDINSQTLQKCIWISGNPFSEDDYGADPSAGGGTNTAGGGYGSPATDTGDVDGESASDLNLLTVINSGMASLYNPTATELLNLSDFLFSGITDSAVDQLKKMINDPIEYILFVALAKFNPPTSGRETIGIGGVSTGVSAQKIVNQFMELDCGSVVYPEQFQSFLDYHGRIQIYLPFCGTHDLNECDVQGSTIKVNYLIDLLSGSCIARVKITRSKRSSAPKDSRVNDVIYEFQGNVYLTMPIGSTDWRGAYSSLVQLAGGIAGYFFSREGR